MPTKKARRFCVVEYLAEPYTTTTCLRSKPGGALGTIEVVVPYANLRAFPTLEAAQTWADGGYWRVMAKDTRSEVRRWAQSQIAAARRGEAARARGDFDAADRCPTWVDDYNGPGEVLS
jgi:hypothetical protein